MIKTVLISSGLIGLTAFGGMALSMAHDLAFAEPASVAGDVLTPVAYSVPSVGSAEAAAIVSSGDGSTAVQADVVHAILESSVPFNRLAGKSAATASANAPVMAIRPIARGHMDRIAAQAAENPSPAMSFAAPALTRQTVAYTPPTPRRPAPVATPVRVPSPVAAAPIARTPRTTAQDPQLLIGVYR